jgi:hypothetical protein
MDNYEYTEDFHTMPFVCKFKMDKKFKDTKKYKCISKKEKNDIVNMYVSYYGLCSHKISKFCELNNLNTRNFKNWFNIYRNNELKYIMK